MKKLAVISNIINEECFIDEVVNRMPVIYEARYSFEGCEDVIHVHPNYLYEALVWLRERHVRAVVTD